MRESCSVDGGGQWGSSLALACKLFGLEAIKQMELVGEYPDVVVGCAGGGSSFTGIAVPFARQNLVEGRRTRLLAVEPTSCPSLVFNLSGHGLLDLASFEAHRNGSLDM